MYNTFDSDFLNHSTALRLTRMHRQHFDPKNPAHLESLKTFVETGNWGEVQFYCERPYTDVPMTVLMKFAKAALSDNAGT